MTRPGELAIVLHTHMPYVEGGAPWPPPTVAAYMQAHGVDFRTALANTPNRPYPEGFGTWPFGEEWLWEAIATSYLPLLDVLDRGQLTLSMTPVLCDQLEAPGAMERCIKFLREVRPESHERDIRGFRSVGASGQAAELERSAAEYVSAAAKLEEIDKGMLQALAPHVTWTSSATHAVLPLLATDAGIELQVRTGIESHRRRFGRWEGGFWLPECGHAPWLHPLLEDAGVRSTCVELTDLYGVGAAEHLRPLETAAGALLWPIDRATMRLVWSDDGYPADPAYRDYHALTTHHHRAWANSGEPYDHAAALDRTREHARHFVATAKSRVAGGGVSVCALDTELLGHWWYEGVAWLGAVVEEAGIQDLTLTTLEDAATRHQPAPAGELPVTTWGEGRDLRTWSAPLVAEMAWRARSGEIDALGGTVPTDRALRELLALQSSDWAFLATKASAGDYPAQRAHAHALALRAAMSGGLEPQLRNLAPHLAPPSRR
jgi:1,4-alpha-glucan branching enzyme